MLTEHADEEQKKKIDDEIVDAPRIISSDNPKDPRLKAQADDMLEMMRAQREAGKRRRAAKGQTSGPIRIEEGLLDVVQTQREGEVPVP